jgi:hypothetical protein
MRALSHLEVPPPILVMLAGVRMHGTTMMGKHMGRLAAQPLKKADFLLPVVAFEDFGSLDDYRGALKPIFDAVWNAAGHGASQSYNAEGNWTRTPT